MGCPALAARLYEPAVDTLTFNCVHTIGQGWRLVVAHRHSGESWDLCEADVYSGLVGDELVELVESTLAAVLRL